MPIGVTANAGRGVAELHMNADASENPDHGEIRCGGGRT